MGGSGVGWEGVVWEGREWCRRGVSGVGGEWCSMHYVL